MICEQVVQNSTSSGNWTSIKLQWRAPNSTKAGNITFRLVSTLMDKTGQNLGIICYSNIVVQCEKGKGKGPFLCQFKLTDKPEPISALIFTQPITEFV